MSLGWWLPPPRQHVHVEAGRAARDADRDAAVVAHQRQQVAVAGVLDEHDVAGAGQGAQDQVEGVGRAMGQQDLLRLDGAQLGGQLADKCWRRRGKAERVAVAAQAAGRDLHRVAHRVQDRRFAIPLGRQPAGADRQRIGQARIQVGGEGVDRRRCAAAEGAQAGCGVSGFAQRATKKPEPRREDSTPRCSRRS
jgi:hypothetical protein